ncbi:class A beta-lactamase [Gluconacetobacter tumulisoli]|uniref:beta-lactamase n=1 Tax=Gluconacetobacter tumulisoli TaxID=1286189 RepID=A0A7W4K490_9PROT|nr:class A beta-lactamase [Gluconacetobacter tumulisoli]MBB2199983.1 class A beta-lactamase [Gluconacetobacter tumulisoli]
MRTPPDRRGVLRAALAIPFVGGGVSWPGRSRAAASAGDRLAALEREAGGRLGVAALNTADGKEVAYRADARFAFCSTFKLLAVSAVLKRSATDGGLLGRRIAYARDEVAAYSPVTAAHVGTGLTVSDLCAAALRHSDNTAANLIVRLLGGPAAVTAFARAIGDDRFRLDRWETALNTAVPGEPRDTTTPAAMMRDMRRLALGDGLDASARATLVGWMRGNTTGDRRIRAGVPAGWSVADKTGSGDYGTTNDIGVAWPPGRPPVVMVIYFTQARKAAPWRDDVVASAARIVAGTFG